MRQARRIICNDVNIEKHRARNMALKELFRTVAPGRRQMPGGVDEAKIERAEMRA